MNRLDLAQLDPIEYDADTKKKKNKKKHKKNEKKIDREIRKKIIYSLKKRKANRE